jgi:hypothetical protein
MIVQEEKEFKKFYTLVNQIFNDGLRLPNQVFQHFFNRFMFEEFDWAMSADFWNTLLQLATESLDSYILMAVIEPNPVDYFYNEFGYYSWFKLPVNISTDDYWDILSLEPEGSPADALLFNSDVVVWVPPSKKWAIWGERSHGICILATSNDQFQLASWRSVDEALKEIVPLHYANQKVPRDFAESLRINYSQKPPFV